MTHRSYTLNGVPVSSSENVSMASLVGVLAVVGALFALISSPLLAATVLVGGLAAAKLLQVGLAAAVRRARHRVREFAIPGVGTVRFRVRPR